MAIKTFTEQVMEHITFLRSNSLNIEFLQVDAGFVRCHALNENERGRGDYVYRTQKNPMKKRGMIGLVTWARGIGGIQLKHSTYGQDGSIEACTFERSSLKKVDPVKAVSLEDVGIKARHLWNQAKETGQSDYLERKRVGAYGIRFMENDYGRVAVIPANDRGGSLRTLQFLNPDGSKRFLKGSVGDGLFHMLRTPKNGDVIGVAESYVTSATCFELTGVPTVCAFHSGNLLSIAKSLLEMFPDSRLIIFADNDRHLEIRGLQNQGVLKARQARDAFKGKITLAIPDFDDCAPSKEASDWNDLVRIKGSDYTKTQIRKLLNISTHQV